MAKRWLIARLFLSNEEGQDNLKISEWHDFSEIPKIDGIAQLMMVKLSNKDICKAIYFEQPWKSLGQKITHWFAWDDDIPLTDVVKWAYLK
jgi:hypothetical protein